MYAVGRLGSYITRVSAPFHPFGGAVDIIVVEQQDGSFKSSPWYVRFGKFQGVLKAKENVVDISVNGEGANFHMYLDHTGQAYFLQEVDAEGDIILSSTSSGKKMNGQDRRPVKAMNGQDRRLVKANSWNYGDDPSDSVTQLEVSNGKVLARTGSRRSRLLGLVFGRKSMQQNKFQENGADVVRMDSLERAEIAADLLEMKWSTNLSSVRKEKDNASCLSDSGVSKVGSGTFRHQSTIYYETLDSSGIELDDFGEQADEMMLLSSIKSGEVSVQAETSPNLEFITEASSEVKTHHVHGSLGDGSVLTETSSEPTSVQHIDDSAKEVETCSAITGSSLSDSISQVQDVRSIEEEDEMKRCQPFGEPFRDSQEVSSDVVRTEALNSSSSVGLEEEQLLLSDLDDFKLGEVKGTELISLDHMDKENYSSLISEEIKSDNESFHSDFASDSSPHKFVLQGNLPNNGEELIEEAQVISSQIEIPRRTRVAGQELGGTVRSLPIIRSHFDEVDEHFLHCPLGHSLYSNFKSSKWTLRRENVSGFIKSDAESVHCLSNSQPTTVDALNFEVLKNIDTSPAVGDSSKIFKTSSGNRSAWPFAFKRSRSMKDTQPDLNCPGSLDAKISLEGTIGMDLQNEVSKLKVTKKNIRAISPTTEQLASLNLKEGGNIVTFTFSTSMLGKQQVDARVYLWRWDTRVVITDVDGTITKSDVLGQFMPLVGKDWSQRGVAHLFSAIKENGYQLLFLSARAISQAGLTRQFLFNLKQDGKGLPDGPVVISPDGLFPSLFREVIRRAPHEFKIACLEDIKACFPSDRNPFYAGFGNRDTDEFSYLKVGIPIGKIFIINPKGEVVVNSCDNKSYTSLHALVNGMFPSMSSEQEGFNSWNFWKLPLPLIDI